MATHSSVLDWRIPGTEEPGGLPNWGRTESDTTEAGESQGWRSLAGYSPYGHKESDTKETYQAGR